MYSIEYYKTKRTLKNPAESNDIRIKHLLLDRYYNQKTPYFIDKCLNIKSLTIDLEDINHIMQDRNLKHLPGLFAIVDRNIAPKDNDIEAITILNNNYSNWLFIYEILNCSWMVNNDEEVNNLDILKTISHFFYLTEQYDNVDDLYAKKRMKNEMNLIKYYLHTLIKKNKSNQTVKHNSKTLKLGKRIIK